MCKEKLLQLMKGYYNVRKREIYENSLNTLVLSLIFTFELEKSFISQVVNFVINFWEKNSAIFVISFSDVLDPKRYLIG